MIIPAFPSWWADKFHDLPLRPSAVEVPQFDGDTSQLEELRDRIELAAATLTTPELIEAFDYVELCGGSIEADTFLSDADAWPDLAGVLIEAWKSQVRAA